jgi:hypothetical protein
MNKSRIRAAFSACIKYMWDGQGERDWQQKKHICDALSEATYSGEITAKQADAARDVIHARMHPEPNVIQWLIAEGKVTFESAYKEDQGTVQEFRHLWVQTLIKEFS